jgi:hypothetical protein
MYHFMNKALALGRPEPIIEEDFQPLSVPEMTVWDESHPKPPGGPDYERSLVKYMTEESDRQIAALTPSDSATLEKFREIVGGALDVMIGRSLPAAGDVEFQQAAESPLGEAVQRTGLVRNKPHEEELPVVVLHPKNWNKRVVIWAHEAGKAGLFGPDGAVTPAVQALLAAGSAVLGADLLYQGEFLADGKPLEHARRVDNPRQFAGYTLGYNPALPAQRVHDLLTLVTYAQTYGGEKPQVDLVGSGACGAWVAAARAQAGGAVARSAIDTAGFRFAGLKSTTDLNFLPGAVKYGDLPGMLALGAPGELWLSGEQPMPPGIVSAAYTAAGAAAKLQTHGGPAEERQSEAVKWLTRP